MLRQIRRHRVHCAGEGRLRPAAASFNGCFRGPALSCFIWTSNFLGTVLVISYALPAHVRSCQICNVLQHLRMRWCDTDSLHSSASVEISGGLEEQDLPHVVQSRGINIPVGLRADGAGRVDRIIMTTGLPNLVHLVPGKLRDQVSQTGSPAKQWKLSNAPSTSIHTIQIIQLSKKNGSDLCQVNVRPLKNGCNGLQ